MNEVFPVLSLIVVIDNRVNQVFFFRHIVWRFVITCLAIIDGRVEICRHVKPIVLVEIDHMTSRQIDDRLPCIFAWEVPVSSYMI